MIAGVALQQVLPMRAKKLFVISLYVAFQMIADAHAQSNERLMDWTEEVLLSREFSEKTGVIKWGKSPHISIFGGDAKQERIVKKVVSHINETLNETPIKQIVISSPDQISADIHVHFIPLDEMPSVAKDNGFSYTEGNWGFFWVYAPRSTYEIERAVVLVASDKLKGKILRHIVLEEITQSLGLMNDSSIVDKSIFLQDWDDRQYLSSQDKKLIKFLYNHVEPGADRQELEIAFRNHW